MDLLEEKLNLLDDGCQELEKVAGDYDYSEKIQGNGFSSFISICSIFKQKVNQSEFTSKQMIEDYTIAASTLLKILNILKEMKDKGPDVDYNIVTEYDMGIMAKVNTIRPNDIVPFYDQSSVGPFWLRDFAQKEQLGRQWMTELLSANSWWDRIKLFFSSRFVAECAARSSVTSSITKITDLMLMFSRFPLNIIYKLMSSKPRGILKRDVWVPRSNPFVIQQENNNPPSVIQKSSEIREGQVRCLLLTPENTPQHQHDGKSLIFHVHGGAFMVGSPEMFALALAKPCIDLNVPVLSVDYGLAPDHKFPSGIQDILDVYFWLTSGSEEVVQMLGFRPTKIVLAGESSGANMAFALSYALTMIKDLGHDVLMPKGLSIQCPCIVPAPVASPSGVMMTIDPCVTTGWAAVSIAAYPEHENPVPDDWHLEPKTAQQVVDGLKERIKDPLYNVLAGDYISRLQDMKLSLLACEFDPLLDQGIAIAKRWPSKSRFMIAKGLPHGLTMSHIEKATKEFDWITEGIREMIEE